MAKGMLSLTVALLLSAMCTVEGQSAASGAAAAGPTTAAAAAAAASGGGYDGPRYGGGGYGGAGGYGGVGYLPYGYNTYLPRGYSSSYENAVKKINSKSGVDILSQILDRINIAALNNAPNSQPRKY